MKQSARLECGLELSSMGMWEPKPETAFEESMLPSFLLLHAFGVARRRGKWGQVCSTEDGGAGYRLADIFREWKTMNNCVGTPGIDRASPRQTGTYGHPGFK